MIRPSAVLAFLLALFLLMAGPLAGPLVADEGPQEDSAAAKLFRDAWWAETGRGALDKALDGYTKAAAAEGSEAIRARAVYRSALVLQRMGRSPEAVKALQRLAQDFPGQAALLAKAKQHLDEWDAEDLRGKFSDWYRRYQYGAEFQAKIVDLILKLGGSDNKAGQAARQELLTIGLPALDALKEHTRSPNSRLRSSAVGLIIDIGALPDPDVLWKAGLWRSKSNFWKLLHASKGAERAAYAASVAAQPDDFRARWIEAVLAGPEAVVAVVAKEKSDVGSVVDPYLMQMLDTDSSPAVYAAVRAVVADTTANANVRGAIAKRLLTRWELSQRNEKEDATGLTPDEILSWVDSDIGIVREAVYLHMRAAGIPSPEAWRHGARRVRALPVRDREMHKALGALNGQLRLAAQDADLTPAIEAVSHVLSEASVSSMDTYPLIAGDPIPGDGAIPLRVLVSAIKQTRGDIMRGAPQYFWSRFRGVEGALEALLDIAKNAVDAGARTEAVALVAYEIRADIGRLTALLDAPEARAELEDKLFHGLRNNPSLTRLDWSAEGLTRLAETAMAYEKYSPTSRYTRTLRVGVSNHRFRSNLSYGASAVFFTLLQEPSQREKIFAAALAAPERYPRNFFSHVGPSFHNETENRAWALEHIQGAWRSWTPAQRGPGLKLFITEDLLGAGAKEPLPFLREVLAEGDLDASTRLHVVRHMPELSLADLKRIYDFSKPEEVEQAAAFLPRLPETEEVYDAFLPGLAPTSDNARHVAEHFRSAPASRFVDLVRKMLAHRDPGLHADAMEVLTRRTSAEDLPLWIEALGHAEADVRTEAAKMLGTLYDDAAIKALARAVDDPDPSVRDAVLASLERIEKIEQQKRRWREFARDKTGKK